MRSAVCRSNCWGLGKGKKGKRKSEKRAKVRRSRENRVEGKELTFMVMSREDIGLAGLPAGVGASDISNFFLSLPKFLFAGILERKEVKRARGKKGSGRKEIQFALIGEERRG